MAELTGITPEHPFTNGELFAAALSLGVVAWLLPVGADLVLGYGLGAQYEGSGLAHAVTGFGRPVLVGLGAVLLGFADPRRGWRIAPAIAFGDLFFWLAAATPAVRRGDVDWLEGLVQPLLKILALTAAPAAAAGLVRSTGHDERRSKWQS